MNTSLHRMMQRYGVRPRGVLHLGAHLGQEAALYSDCGFDRVVWIEGDPRTFERLQATIGHLPGHEAHNVLVADTDDRVVDFHVASNDGAASSMLEFDSELLASSFPELKVDQHVQLRTRRLDSFLAEKGIDVGALNFLNVDLQGAELMAMRGMGELLGRFDLICSEVNLARLYKSSALLHELDTFLAARGFRRARLSLFGIQGQAYYVPDARLRSSALRRGAMVGGAHLVEGLYRAGVVDAVLRLRKHAFPYSALRSIYRSAFRRDGT